MSLLLARAGLSMWASARPRQGCLCGAEGTESKLRRTRSLQIGHILGSGTCSCQEGSNGTQVGGCGVGCLNERTHGFLWENDTRVSPEHAVGRCRDRRWQLPLGFAHMVRAAGGILWGEGQGSRGRLCCLDTPTRAHCWVIQ